ncbi:UNVERIFIED_CONTAM: hypothetical protein PYX00_003389 [Menopon gallinae]|uniref:Gelsolin-like domain-containing protein n=1 Tax=Menopon gallinae TaxID=328185 RepID=A0AAW2HZV2_9NEOP
MISHRSLFLLVVCVACVAAQRLANPVPASVPTGVKNTAKDANSNTQNLPVNRAAAARVFGNAGKKEGIEIWRIENFTPVPVKQSEFGKFYEGDSYLVLKTKNAGGKLSWDIHYWIGDKSTQDESGSAAIFAVELDDSLGGAPVQHREVQGHESQLFTSYFPTPLRYLTGGVKSGFHHVTPNAVDGTKKLYQVKGKKDVRIRQIEPVYTAMNKGDCFILDSGDKIYVYYGVGSKKTERLKAVSAANQIRDQDHSGRAPVKILDQAATPEEIEEFFTVLGGGTRKTLPEASAGGDDEKFEKEIDAQVSLYKVSDASGSLKIEKIGEKPLSQTSLNTNDCFILDTVTSGIFSWIGRRATKMEKEEALRKGEEFLKTKNYPSWTRITRVIEGGEPATFKQFFKEWRTSGDLMGIGRR